MEFIAGYREANAPKRPSAVEQEFSLSKSQGQTPTRQREGVTTVYGQLVAILGGK